MNIKKQKNIENQSNIFKINIKNHKNYYSFFFWIQFWIEFEVHFTFLINKDARGGGGF